MKRLLFLLCVLLALSACRSARRPPMPAAVVTPLPQTKMSPASNPGSLYDPDGVPALFTDARAHRVGDIVLVRVVETTLAKNKASTTTDKSSSSDYGVSSFLGRASVPLLSGAAIGEDSIIGTTSENDFAGNGETKRESIINTTVASRITRVLGGGLMEVAGAREIRINGETQIVVVQGVARKQDVSADNSIYSTNLADARIELYGEGILAEKQRPGWLGRILENMWPF